MQNKHFIVMEDGAEYELTPEEEAEIERKIALDKAKNQPELAKIVHSSERVAGGMAARHEDITTYTLHEDSDKVYVIKEETDDLCDCADPYFYEISFDQMIEELAEASRNAKATYTDLYSGCYDVIEDDCLSCDIRDISVLDAVKSKMKEVKDAEPERF